MNLNRESMKLLLLAAFYLICFVSFFTSESFYLSESGLQPLRVAFNDKTCRKPQLALQECVKRERQKAKSKSTPTGSNKFLRDVGWDQTNNERIPHECADAYDAASTCQSALKKAYRSINLGGCTRLLQSYEVCQADYCDDGEYYENGAPVHVVDKKECEAECNPVKSKLQECSRGYVEKYMRRAGITSGDA